MALESKRRNEMANYYAYARSNYFGVKDEKKFIKWAESRDLEIEVDEDGLFSISPSENNDWSGWPYYNDETDSEINICEELSHHLQDEHVAILQEIGHGKLRYLVGFALAVNNKGEVKKIDIHNDIYEIAKNMGKHITIVEY